MTFRLSPSIHRLANLVIFVFFALSFFSVSTSAQIPVNLQPSGSNEAIQAIDSQLETITLNQKGITELRDRKINLERENEGLERENIDVRKNISDLEFELENPGSEDRVEEINTSLEDNRKQLDINVQKLTKNKQLIEEIDVQIEEREADVVESVDLFRDDIVKRVRTFLPHILVASGLWLFYNVFSLVLARTNINQKVKTISKIIVFTISLLITLFIALIAFAGSWEFIFASLSLLSAALVFALQDFVASFFAWILLRIRGYYRVGDVIQVIKDGTKVNGKIIQVGMFRSYMNERLGDDSVLDSEKPTGRIFSFPNSLILKEPIVNFTQNNKILMQKLEVTITFESDFEKCRKVLTKILDEWYIPYAKKRVYKSFKPDVLLSIADSGVLFTLWFPVEIGTYRKNLDLLSVEVLKKFAKNDINLAYPTKRSLVEKVESVYTD